MKLGAAQLAHAHNSKAADKIDSTVNEHLSNEPIQAVAKSPSCDPWWFLFIPSP